MRAPGWAKVSARAFCYFFAASAIGGVVGAANEAYGDAPVGFTVFSYCMLGFVATAATKRALDGWRHLYPAHRPLVRLALPGAIGGWGLGGCLAVAGAFARILEALVGALW